HEAIEFYFLQQLWGPNSSILEPKMLCIPTQEVNGRLCHIAAGMGTCLLES
ncbi:hypothetical protein PIB30_110193, partial [Stylosanthes scabra]|nr:hypothetical protein [Stylosanthes scabra]